MQRCGARNMVWPGESYEREILPEIATAEIQSKGREAYEAGNVHLFFMGRDEGENNDSVFHTHVSHFTTVLWCGYFTIHRK